jgi:hypothetical protein
MTEVVKTIQMHFKNTTGETLIVAGIAGNQEFKLKFLNNFEDYVQYNPFVMEPDMELTINYKLTYNKEEIEDAPIISEKI